MMWGRKVPRGEIDPRGNARRRYHPAWTSPVTDIRKIRDRNFVNADAGMGERLTVRNIAELVSEYQDFAALA